MKILIIGNGIAGITAARHIRKNSDHEIIVISGETDHFYSRTALMYIFMGHMRFEETKPYEDWFWMKNRIQLYRAWVETVDTDQKHVILDNGKSMSYDKLIIATGSSSNYFGWPGQDLKGVQGLYNMMDLEELEKNAQHCKHAVIVGGGLIGIELGEMLHSRHIPVTFLIREDSYWNNVLPPGESAMVSKHIREHGFNLITSKNLGEIIGDERGCVTGIKIKETGEEIECDLVGITAGVHPNIEFIKSSKIDTNRGVLVNHYLETNIPDVYAIGDCAEFKEPIAGRRPIEQVWYTGRMQGEVLAQNIVGNRQPYRPGPWFNSAKFLDIEYQTYGMVMPKLKEGEESLYWEHPDGKMCVHIVYQPADKKFIGINTFGIRMRHHLFDQWLREEQSVEYVLRNLRAANFDPEFCKMYEREIIQQYNQQTGSSVYLQSKRSFSSVLSFLKK